MKGAFAYVPARFQEISGHGVRNSRICPPLVEAERAEQSEDLRSEGFGAVHVFSAA